MSKPASLPDWLPASVAAALALAPAGALHPGETRGQLHVTITVPEVARIESLAAATSLRITSADIARGFIDVPEPAHLAIYCNAAEGFTLEVRPLSPQIRSIAVSGLGNEAEFGAEGGALVQRLAGDHRAAYLLRFRLGLAPELQPGVYPWPVHLAVAPLHEGR